MFVTIAQGVRETLIISGRSMASSVESCFASEQLLLKKNNIAALTLRLVPDSKHTRNFSFHPEATGVAQDQRGQHDLYLYRIDDFAGATRNGTGLFGAVAFRLKLFFASLPVRHPFHDTRSFPAAPADAGPAP